MLLSAEVFERIEHALEQVEARKVQEIVEAGLRSQAAGRVSPHEKVAARARRARAQRKKA